MGMTIEKALNVNPTLKDQYENNEEIRLLIDYAMKVEAFLDILQPMRPG